jgi:hypothetical protein
MLVISCNMTQKTSLVHAGHEDISRQCQNLMFWFLCGNNFCSQVGVQKAVKISTSRTLNSSFRMTDYACKAKERALLS